MTRAQVLQLWTRELLDTALRKGTVTRLLPGIYCGTSHVRRPRVVGEALNLWQPVGLVTGALALHLLDPQLPVPRVAELLVPHGHRVRAPDWVRVRQLEAMPTVAICSGIRCATADRALLDAWRSASPAARSDLLYTALWAGVCRWEQLATALADAPRIPERPKLQRLLEWYADGAASPLEVRARHETFAGPRFREFQWQVQVPLAARTVRVDMLHERAKVIVELDGDAYHATRQARDADRERQTELAAAGYVVIRLGWRDIAERPEWCRQRVLEVLTSRLNRRKRRPRST